MIAKILVLAHASGNSEAYYVWKAIATSKEIPPEETAKECILAQPERKRSFAEQNLAEMEELLRQSWLLQSYRGLACRSSQESNWASCLVSLSVFEFAWGNMFSSGSYVISQEITVYYSVLTWRVENYPQQKLLPFKMQHSSQLPRDALSFSSFCNVTLLLRCLFSCPGPSLKWGPWVGSL